MSVRVLVIDYKAGNLASVVKALKHLGAEVDVTDEPRALENAERVILPGVGHFAATRRLDDTGMTKAIAAAIERQLPFLGICVGMQWLLSGSTEAPDQPGFGYFHARCERFPDSCDKVPHVGWNQIVPRVAPPSQLLMGIEDNEYVYFSHSYRAPAIVQARRSDGSWQDSVAAVTNYIQPFASAVEYGRVFGVQFHPEKSGETGLKLLRNFLAVEPC